jgi:hypothetical protein
MKPHDTFVELAAISIDFPLPAADRGRLDQHLAGCSTCWRTASALRYDAQVLADLPPVILPERRAAAILDGALHHRRDGNPVRLIVLAVLLGLLIIASIPIGAAMLRRINDDDLFVVVPVPTGALPTNALPTDPSASAAPAYDNGVGLSWARVDLPAAWVPDVGGAAMRGVIAGGPGAIAWGWAYGQAPRIWTTADGGTWEPATVEVPDHPDPDAGNPGTISAITAGGPGYVAVGYYDRLGTGRRGLVWTSVDGRAWALVPSGSQFEHVMLDEVLAWQGGLHLYGQESAGADEGEGLQLAWESPDGETWMPGKLSIPDGFRFSMPILASDRLWAFGFPVDPDLPNGWQQTRWLTSTDGWTWAQADLPRYPGPLFPLADRILTLLQPFPTSGDSAPPDVDSRPEPGVYRSTDATTWEPLWTGRSMEGYDLVEVGGTLVVVGDNSAGDPECWAECQAMGWRSTDGGASWLAVPADRVGGTMTAVVALPDGTLVAIGRLVDDRGSPGQAAWVSIPAAQPPTEAPAEPTPATPAASAGALLGDAWTTSVSNGD